MSFKYKIFIFVFSLLLPGAAQAADEAETPSDYLQSIYAHYQPGKKPLDVLGKDMGWLFTEKLIDVINTDQKLAADKGEVPNLNGDPICNCQEYDKLDNVKITSESENAGMVSVNVSFNNNGEEVRLVFDLEQAGPTWKIDDIFNPNIGSLRAFLIKASEPPAETAEP